MRIICLILFTLIAMPEPSFVKDKEKSELLSLEISAAGGRHVEVRLLNHSDSPIRFWQDTNSWGIAHWRVLVFSHDKLTTLYQESDEILSLDTPSFTEISAGKSQTIHLNLNENIWLGDRSKKIALRTGDVITVILDVPRSTEGDKLNVWHGVVAALLAIK